MHCRRPNHILQHMHVFRNLLLLLLFSVLCRLIMLCFSELSFSCRHCAPPSYLVYCDCVSHYVAAALLSSAYSVAASVLLLSATASCSSYFPIASVHRASYSVVEVSSSTAQSLLRLHAAAAVFPCIATCTPLCCYASICCIVCACLRLLSCAAIPATQFSWRSHSCSAATSAGSSSAAS